MHRILSTERVFLFQVSQLQIKTECKSLFVLHLDFGTIFKFQRFAHIFLEFATPIWQVEPSFKDLPTLLPSRPQRSRSLVTRQAQKLVERIRGCWEKSWFQPFLALIRIARIGLGKASPVQWGSLEEVVCCSRTLLMQFVSSESYKLSVREQCNLTSTLPTT